MCLQASLLDDTADNSEGAQLQTGEMAHPWSWDYFGLYYQYIAVGAFYGSMNPLMYPIFKQLLGMPSYSVKGGYQVMTVWWSLKLFIGGFSDCFPIFGYRRKPYILAGWLGAVVMVIILMTLGQPAKGDAPYPYLVLLSLVNLFYIWGDVACDGMLADYAQREPIHKRGQLQSTIYFIRFITMSGVASLMAFGFSSEEYGGDFDWGFKLPEYLIILVVIGALGLYPYYRLKEEPIHKRKSYTEHFSRLFNRMKLDAFWRVVAFSFLVHFFAYFNNTAAYDIMQTWCGTKPWVDGLFSNVIAYLFMSSGIWVTKRYFLNTSWRKLLTVLIIFMAFTTYIPQIIIDTGLVRSQFFYVGAPLMHQFIYGMFFIVCTFCAVEIAEKGSEGITYGFITTVGNLSIPFTNVLSALLMSNFEIYDENHKLLDTDHARKEMIKADTVICILQLCALPTLLLLPSQKQDIQRLIASNARSPKIAIGILIAMGFCLVWSIMGNFMQIFESTSCLKMVGGKGC